MFVLPDFIRVNVKIARPAREGRQNTWGSDWLVWPKILVKRLVMGAIVKRVEGL